ncbi:MAG: alpha/beta hydrolase [Actinomycetota bacterium]
MIPCSDEGEGSVVVLLHGSDSSSAMWKELVPLLVPWMRVIVPDFGDSADARDRAAAVRELLEELQVTEEFAAAGHDSGGDVAQILALEGGVKTLVLFGCKPAAPIEELERLEMPAFLLWGEDDEIVPHAVAEGLSDALDASTLALIPGCGHSPIEEDIATAGPLVYEFLRARFLGRSHGHSEEPIPIEVLTQRPEPPR